MPPNNDSLSKPNVQWFDPRAMREFDSANDPNAVVGRRWLCKASAFMIIGQSGTGKSSLMMQFAVRWAVGLDAFGLKPKEPLRSVIINSENDFGDMAEAYQGAIAGAALSETQLEVLDANLAIVRNTNATGNEFVDLLKQLIGQHNAAMVWVDPLLAFAGFDISSQLEVGDFLRKKIDPILKETGAILCFMHHTTKPKKESENEEITISSLAYQGAGSAEFVNYSREIGYLMKAAGDNNHYKFGLTKRRSRSGLRNQHGEFKREILIKHSSRPGVIAWEYADDDSTGSPEASKSNAKASPRRFS